VTVDFIQETEENAYVAGGIQMEETKNLLKSKYLVAGTLMYMIIILGTINPFDVLYYTWLKIAFRILACTFVLPFLVANWVIIMSKAEE